MFTLFFAGQYHACPKFLHRSIPPPSILAPSPSLQPFRAEGERLGGIEGGNTKPGEVKEDGRDGVATMTRSIDENGLLLQAELFLTKLL